MAVGTPDSLKKAVTQLNNGVGRDRENSDAYRFLAQAYGELGDVPAADLATAEGHYYSGDYKNAKIFAMRAQQKLKRGEPRWVRAQDIINYTPSNKLK
jgi:predicted Zn-dependent protease